MNDPEGNREEREARLTELYKKINNPDLDLRLREKQTIEMLNSRMGKGIPRWRDVLDYLKTLTDEQLDQEAMLLPPNPTGSLTLLEPIFAFGTVEEMCHVDGEVVTETRSGNDFKHHPEQVVALYDYAPYDEDGNTFFELVDGGFKGNKTGKIYPIGGKNGE